MDESVSARDAARAHLRAAIVAGWEAGDDLGPYLAALHGPERSVIVEVRPTDGSHRDRALAVAEAASIAPAVSADAVMLVGGAYEVDPAFPESDPRHVVGRLVMELEYRRTPGGGELVGSVSGWDPEEGLSEPNAVRAFDLTSPVAASLILSGSGVRPCPGIRAGAIAAAWGLADLGHRVLITRAARRRLGHWG